MFEKYNNFCFEYILSTRNSKALYTSKVAHLHRYDDEVIALQQKVGLARYAVCPSQVLPEPAALDVSLQTAMQARASRRDFSDAPLTPIEVSSLLHYGFGYNPLRPGRKFAPSSGGFHTTEAFVVLQQATEIPLGLYYYEAQHHVLRCIQEGSFQEWVSNDVFYQSDLSRCAMVLVLASDLQRLSKKYYTRAYRMALLDAGHAAQNVYLASSALGLKVCEALGYIENEVEEAFGLDGCSVLSVTTLAIGR